MTIADIADSVRDTLNSQSWALPFHANRKYRPIFTLNEFGVLRVSVAPRELKRQLISRGTVQREDVIDVGVQKRFSEGGTDDDDEADTLLLLCEQIAENLLSTVHEGSICYKTDYGLLYDPVQFEEDRQFTGVVTVFLKGTTS